MKYKFSYYRPITDYEYFLLEREAIQDLIYERKEFITNIPTIIKNIGNIIKYTALIYWVKFDALNVDNKKWIDVNELVHPEVIRAKRTNGLFGEKYNDETDENGYIFLTSLGSDSIMFPSKHRLFVKLECETIYDLPLPFDYSGIYFRNNFILFDYNLLSDVSDEECYRSFFFRKYKDGIIEVSPINEKE
jgi:hypothetical protein